MRTKLIALAAAACVAALVSSFAAAGQTAARQRIAITAKGGIYGFVLKPFGSGHVKRDEGSASWCCWKRRFIKRDGQAIEVNDPMLTLQGVRGELTLRFRTEWSDAGNGYSVGNATWKVISGTDAYKGLRGSGRSSQLWIGQDATSWRAEGYVR